MANKTLAGRRIAILVTDGFEKVELTVPMKALKKAGAQIEIVSLKKGRIRGVNLHEPASRITVDRSLDEVTAFDYDGLLIPGGFINPDLLRQSVQARNFVRSFDRSHKPIATLCHGPWLLASAGLTEGRALTSWPGIRDDMVNAGATWIDREVVRDRNLVTSRGPQDLGAFVPEIIEHFSKSAVLDERVSANLRSAPQADAPPALVLNAINWMPRPSIRTAFGIAALVAAGAGIAARRSSQMKSVRGT